MLSKYASNDDDDNDVEQDRNSSGHDDYDNSVKSTKSCDGAVMNNAIGTKETKAVARSRLLVLFVIFISALSVSISVFIFMVRQEKATFTEAYIRESDKILKSATANMKLLVGSMDTLSTIIISHARNSSSEWPFVTLPDFPNHASKLLSSGVGNTVMMAVNVKPEERSQWEQYSMDNSNIVQSALRIMETDRNYYGDIDFNESKISPVIVNMDSSPIPYNTTLFNHSIGIECSRDLCPVWQMYPLGAGSAPHFNLDYCALHPEIESEVQRKQKAYITPCIMNPDPNNDTEVLEAKYLSEEFRKKIPQNQKPLEPTSDLIYPVIDYLDSVTVSNNTEIKKSRVVGSIMQTFYWRDLMKDSLPMSNDGLTVVYDTECTGRSFTYRIDGPNPVYLGYGDLHERKYDEAGFTGALSQFAFALSKTKYNGLPLNTEYCMLYIRFYPSTIMINRFLTWDPLIFSICSCLIFVFTSIVFLVYDTKVERRQKVVLTSAERTNAVVSSLFPSQVRDQILNDANKTDALEDDKKIFFQKSEMFGRKDSMTTDGIFSEQALSRPIADLYPDTTVLFADIKGFTFWSATHTPVEVFTLLETLYGEFDKCARSRNVFKVETIGDCYVAVVGLPEPRKKHAVIMVRFAEDMLKKITLVLHNLVPTLGEKTLELELRIGLNSGPTTAGVLRGEKSRFQLFGDTVNTAARMESNGMPSRIHCSQATADLLCYSGKKNWLVKREDLVDAKGKGSMQTYWVKPTSEASSGSGTSVTNGSESNADPSHVGETTAFGMVLDAIDEMPLVSDHESMHSF